LYKGKRKKEKAKGRRSWSGVRYSTGNKKKKETGIKAAVNQIGGGKKREKIQGHSSEITRRLFGLTELKADRDRWPRLKTWWRRGVSGRVGEAGRRKGGIKPHEKMGIGGGGQNALSRSPKKDRGRVGAVFLVKRTH